MRIRRRQQFSRHGPRWAPGWPQESFRALSHDSSRPKPVPLLPFLPSCPQISVHSGRHRQSVKELHCSLWKPAPAVDGSNWPILRHRGAKGCGRCEWPAPLK